MPFCASRTSGVGQKEFGPDSYAYRRASVIRIREELATDYNEFLPNAVVAMGRALSPNPAKPPFYADLPFRYFRDTDGTDVTRGWGAMKFIEKRIRVKRKY